MFILSNGRVVGEKFLSILPLSTRFESCKSYMLRQTLDHLSLFVVFLLHRLFTGDLENLESLVQAEGTALKATLDLPKSKPLKKLSILTPVDEDILKAVWFHHFITAEQLLRHRDRSINGLAKM